MVTVIIVHTDAGDDNNDGHMVVVMMRWLS